MMLCQSYFLKTLFVVGFANLVFSKDSYSIKKEILDMEEHANGLKQENGELNKKLNDVTKQCNDQEQLYKGRAAKFSEELLAKEQVLLDVVAEHNKKTREQAIIEGALNRAYLENNKYALKVDLYTQQLDLLITRKKTDISRRCQMMKPLFNHFASTFTTRSLPGHQKASGRAEIIALQNDLNTHKLKVQEISAKNQNLKIEIESYVRSCEARIKQEKAHSEATLEEINKAVARIDLLQIEVKEISENNKAMEADLKKITEETEQLKAQALALKGQIDTYFEDTECYKKITELTFQYK